MEGPIFPFLWMRGEDESLLRREIEKIATCGIRAICVEARPHDDFCGPGWWHDMDIVLEEAKKRDMRIWILDDKHFPTGYANGLIETKYPERRKQYLACTVADVFGASCERVLNVGRMLKPSIGFWEIGNPVDYAERANNRLLALVALRFTEGEAFHEDALDLTATVDGEGFAHFSLPEGAWRVHALYLTRTDGGNPSYINMLDRTSAHTQIEGVYEAHFAHYADEFGKTIAGFFSDEPQFGNINDQVFDTKLGKKKMPLLWSDELAGMLQERHGDDLNAHLPFLFAESAENAIAPQIRFDYMDCATKLYAKNFSRPIGEWCRAHGVEYIGHVVEDNGVHSRLGLGAGHWFRAMEGQDMAGIDVIGSQFCFGAPAQTRKGMTEVDGEFFHYALGKLGASGGHLDPRKWGRTMCELFGAYGWSEGLTYMKWMADHMLVNGINRFTPHAFSEAKFPDPDCPPHFYAGGNNPQYRHMHVLYNGMNRAAHLLSGGRSPVDTAVLFSAEAEWTGGFRLPEELGRELMTHQIPYEIISMDILRTASVREGRIEIGTASYRHLVVDSQEYLPEDYLGTLAELESKGAEILFLNTVTKDFSGRPYPDARLIHDRDAAEIFSSGRTVCTDVPSYWLRAYRYDHADLTVYMLQNSSMLHTLEVNVTLPRELGKTVLYYPLENRFERPVRQESGALHFDFGRGESVMVLTGDDLPEGRQTVNKDAVWETLPDDYRISLAAFDAPDAFSEIPERQLQDILSVKKDFAGIIRYETMFYGKRSLLSLGECQEGAEVFINGNSAGVRISYPYRYDISGLTIEGENRLCIEVATTLFGAVRDRLSLQRPVPPAGVLGPVQVS